MGRMQLRLHVTAHLLSQVIMSLALASGAAVGTFLPILTGSLNWRQRIGIAGLFVTAIIGTAAGVYVYLSRKSRWPNGIQTRDGDAKEKCVTDSPGIGETSVLKSILREGAGRLLDDLENIEVGNETELGEPRVNLYYPLKIDQFPDYPKWKWQHAELARWQARYGYWREIGVHARIECGIPAVGSNVHSKKLQRLLMDIQHGTFPEILRHVGDDGPKPQATEGSGFNDRRSEAS